MTTSGKEHDFSFLDFQFSLYQIKYIRFKQKENIINDPRRRGGIRPETS
jgi:hypothetical protein